MSDKNPEVNRIAREIGNYILKETIKKFPDESNHEIFKRVIDEITKLGITSISIKGDNVKISLRRPGLLIGKAGERIKDIEAKIKIKKITVKEDDLMDYLIPYWYANY